MRRNPHERPVLARASSFTRTPGIMLKRLLVVEEDVLDEDGDEA